MKLTVLSLFLIVFLSFTACSREKPATATIRVTYGNPPQIQTNEFALNDQSAIVKSYDFLKDVAEKLELPKKLNLSEDATVAKLENAITVQAGNEPGLFVITANILDHETSVEALNELCAFYAGKEIFNSEKGGSEHKLNVAIVQSAK